ncbi:MAG: citrate/2-methylcitrate synthase [Desulfobacterales bacterium]
MSAPSSGRYPASITAACPGTGPGSEPRRQPALYDHGQKPTPVEERIMDIALILHADHGMNASTFASLVVASTLADIYFSVGSGIAALSGPLHGGANEAAMKNIREIGSPENVASWVDEKLSKKAKISGFGHRVYKVYDPGPGCWDPWRNF